MPESDADETQPAIDLVERRRRPRPGDCLPVPVFVAEGNSEEDWVLWENSQVLHETALSDTQPPGD